MTVRRSRSWVGSVNVPTDASEATQLSSILRRPRLALMFNFGACSDIGPQRQTNQDSVFVSATTLLLADGVGGGPAGDMASATVVRTLASGLGDTNQLPDDVAEQLALANDTLREITAQQPRMAGLATTLTGLLVNPHGALLTHIGDSRAYLLRDLELSQVSHDDSWVQMLVDHGSLSPAQAATHPMRNMIVRSLSGAPADSGNVLIRPVELEAGDRWLLASDGLTDKVGASHLLEALTSESDPQLAAEALVALALRSRSTDNISVVVADVEAVLQPALPRFLGAAEVLPGRGRFWEPALVI